MDHSPRHQCFIYSGAPSAHLQSIGNILIERLNSGYRCIYLNSPVMVSGLRSYLASRGVDLLEQTKRGALLLPSDQAHLVEGRFEVEPMISMLRDAALQAQADGFTGLWASGDMTWEFGSERNLGKLLEYESRLEQLIHETPALSGVCQYHIDTLPANSVQAAACAHQHVYLNESLSIASPYYIPPKQLKEEAPKHSDAELLEMLELLAASPVLEPV